MQILLVLVLLVLHTQETSCQGRATSAVFSHSPVFVLHCSKETTLILIFSQVEKDDRDVPYLLNTVLKDP